MAKQGAKAAVPRLRFPEFWTMAAWREVPLERVAQRTSTKNSDGHVTRVLTNSAEFGVLDQRDYFDKDIATAGKVDGYYVVGKGDYVYNPRTSAIAPVGPISRNNVGEGVMSPLYTVFRFSEDKTDFYEHYFRSSRWHSYLRSAASTGARHDRMSITTSAFMRMPVPVPSREEQQKIADCLTSLGEVIAAQGRKVEALKAHKRGLMQQLFPREGETRPRLRFPEFRNAPEWKRTTLNRVCDMQAGKFVSASEISDEPGEGTYSCYGGNGLRGFTKSFTHSGVFPLIGRQGALCGNVQFAKGEFHATEHALVATPQAGVNVTWLYYTLGKLELNKYATGQAQPGLSVDLLKSVECSVPATETEQQRIADCLSSLDTQITAETNHLAALKTHKQGLMQQLFPVAESVAA